MADTTMTLQVEDPTAAALPWVRFLNLQGSGNGISFDSIVFPERFTVTLQGVFVLIFQAATGVSFPKAPTFSTVSSAVVLSSFGSSSFTITVTVTGETQTQTVNFTINTSGGPIDPSIAIDPPGGADGDPKEPR